MPIPISSLITHRDPHPVISEDVMVEEAIKIMIEHDVTQIPVLDNEQKPIGLITHKSILHASNNFGVSLDKLHLSHAMIKINAYDMEYDLFDVQDSLMHNSAIALVDNNKKLKDILTLDDAMLFYRRRAEDFVLVEEIESAMKELIGFSRDVETINDFETMTMGNYIDQLLKADYWDFYKPAFKLESDVVRKLFDDVRIIRNHLAHFQGELNEEQRGKLRYCSDWLSPIHTKLQKEYEENNKSDLIDIKDMDFLGRKTTKKVVEEMIASIKGGENAFIDRSQKYSINKYFPLASWLQDQPNSTDSLRISFEQIEQIIDADLPPSAYKHRAWWANDANSHVQAKAWLDAGWRVGYRNMSAQEVNFTRIKERERAYIDFFGPLIKRLTDETDLPIKDSSPDGTSWITMVDLPETGRKHASINMSFALGSRCRIELYIDTENQTKNKAIFDTLKNQQTEIEKELGYPLTNWERLDEKRASRIALYHKGSITGGKAELAVLEDWAFGWVQRFYNAIYDRANTAIEEHTTS